MAVITSLDTFDVRFQTSRELDGSDAMNPDPDYSAAYVQLRTNDSTGLCGHGFVFTIGRGNDVQTAALSALRHLVVDLRVDDVVSDLGAFARRLTNDSQLRWLGPEKGVMHMAIGAVINAAWDMAGRRAGKPVWRLIADMSPEEIVDLIDYRYISDALTRSETLTILQAAAAGQASASGHPGGTWISRLHDFTRVAGLLRREAGAARGRGRQRRLSNHEAQSGVECGGRPAPLPSRT